MGLRLPPALIALVVLVIPLACSACVAVKPHQRQHLAKPEMNPATDALEETFHSHIESAREGGFGGHGASGGGCGCG
jgi:hypothetical protein